MCDHMYHKFAVLYPFLNELPEHIKAIVLQHSPKNFYSETALKKFIV